MDLCALRRIDCEASIYIVLYRIVLSLKDNLYCALSDSTMEISF